MCDSSYKLQTRLPPTQRVRELTGVLTSYLKEGRELDARTKGHFRRAIEGHQQAKLGGEGGGSKPKGHRATVQGTRDQALLLFHPRLQGGASLPGQALLIMHSGDDAAVQVLGERIVLAVASSGPDEKRGEPSPPETGEGRK